MTERLCYIDTDTHIAYFTEAERPWGDDWNDAPHEANAGLPYTHRGDTFKRVAFDPGNYSIIGNGEGGYGLLSVEQINNGEAPWLAVLTPAGEPHRRIHAGVTPEVFAELLEEGGGEAFWPRERDG